MSAGAPSATPSTISSATHAANCLCCIGAPDLSFERAIARIIALDAPRLEYDAAAAFTRLCRASPSMVLSKSKIKLAAKVRGKSYDPLDENDVRVVQDVVLDVYAKTLALERAQRDAKAPRR